MIEDTSQGLELEKENRIFAQTPVSLEVSLQKKSMCRADHETQE